MGRRIWFQKYPFPFFYTQSGPYTVEEEKFVSPDPKSFKNYVQKQENILFTVLRLVWNIFSPAASYNQKTSVI